MKEIESVEDFIAVTGIDPDQELPDHVLNAMRRPPFAQRVRRRTRLSQIEFSERYGIPLGTLQQWEQRRREPDAAAVAYLMVIEQDPEGAARAYAAGRAAA